MSFPFRRALFLVSAAAFALVATQTIVAKDGRVLPANEHTVAPAAEIVLSGPGANAFQLTDAVLANLTALHLSNISLFGFLTESEIAGEDHGSNADCKVFPGDEQFPSASVWTVLDLLSGGALIKTVPIGAVCYPKNEAYDAAKCAEVIGNWTDDAIHARDPTSVMSPLFQGATCMPQAGSNSTTCDLGGFPSYSIKVETVAQVQLAVNLARNVNLRLVIKNTGHDFLGKSCGAGALSIWTHNLKDINYISDMQTPSYGGPAFRIGAGVQVSEIYAAADKYNVTAVGGECKGVGVSGGYIAGGGHSPMSSKFGLGADQVLSIDVVLPSGRFLTANETHNTDLFWALRGGGGATFGVVTSMVVKAHPRVPISGVTFTIVSGPDTNVSDSIFWAAMYAYWRQLPEFANHGSYGYSMVFPRGPAGYTWSMLPWLVPGMPLAQFQAMVAPLFAGWARIGLQVTPEYFEYDNFYSTWKKHFPIEGVANSNLRTASRLFPAGIWADSARREAMFDAVRSVVEDGSALIQYNMKADAPSGTPDCAANSHWRDAVWYAIMGAAWADGLTKGEFEAINRKITDDWMGRLRSWGPGGYGNEGDVMEPDFGSAFFGTNYDRLLRVKRSVDPTDVFWAPTAVGSDRWRVSGQGGWLTTQTGRLCRA